MFKFEDLSSYNLLLEWGYFVYIEIPLRLIQPRPNIQSP